jgi:hypothetical protein
MLVWPQLGQGRKQLGQFANVVVVARWRGPRIQKVVLDPPDTVAATDEVLERVMREPRRFFELRLELGGRLASLEHARWRPLTAGDIGCGVRRQRLRVDRTCPSRDPAAVAPS